eukprot:gene12629-28164_t
MRLDVVVVTSFFVSCSTQTIKPGCLPTVKGFADLWCPGDNNYTCYKIPSLLKIPDTEVVLGFIEARKYSCADDGGHVDILSKRSTDNGVTFSTPIFVAGNSTDGPPGKRDWHTVGDALPVYDRVTHDIHLIFTRDNLDVFYSRSDDAGLTWKAPVNISSSVRAGAGGQGAEFCGTGHQASSDSGTSWHRRGAIDAPANEWTLAPTDGTYGEILANVRSKAGHRIEARSTDGTISWGKSKVMKQLPEPISGCEGGMIFHPNGKLYFSHPDDPATHLRNKMVIKVSEDKGQTWSDHVEIWGPHSGCKLEDGCVPAASYSSMAVLDAGDKDSEVGLLFMRNNKTMLIFEGTPAYTTFKP